MTLLTDTSVVISPPDDEDGEPVVVSVVSVGELHAGIELARDPGSCDAHPGEHRPTTYGLLRPRSHMMRR